MHQPMQYHDEAAEFFRFQRRFFMWMAGFAAGVPAGLLVKHFGGHWHEAVTGTLMIVIIGGMLYCFARGIMAHGEVLRWRCPCCGKTFCGPWYWKGFWPYDCYYCRLTLTPSWYHPAEPFWEARPSQQPPKAESESTQPGESRT